VRHGYVIELLEPQTSWCKSASKLAQKNAHNVPRESIQRMLERYERTTAGDLIKVTFLWYCMVTTIPRSKIYIYYNKCKYKLN